MDPFDRQARFAPLGADGQARISASRVAVVGCGALGGASADILVRAGVRAIRLIDRDVVEASNLHRQSLFTEADALEGRPKAVAAAERLVLGRAAVEVDARVADLHGGNARRLLDGCDLVLDGTDSFESRHVINEACLSLGAPWVHAACLGSRATVWALLPGGPCFACLVPEPPPPGGAPTCETAGIIPPAAHAAAALQSAEGLKILAGRLEAVRPGPFTLDVWDGTSAFVPAVRDGACRACARGDLVHLDAGRERDLVACGRAAVHLGPPPGGPPDLGAVARSLAGREGLRLGEHLVRFRAEGHDLTLFADGRILVGGLSDPAAARSLAARWLGG